MVNTEKYWLLSFLLPVLLLTACSQTTEWIHHETISLDRQVNPLGITYSDGSIWISAPDQKKVLQIDKKGNILKEYANLERPMHIAAAKGKVYVPIYLEDRIAVIQGDSIQTMKLDSLPDAPAGVWVKGDTVAVADFYNHRIILQAGEQANTIGSKGYKKSQLFYPTDVELVGNEIYVADAYNNRVQVFNKDGKALQLIGEKQNINVATGLTVYEDQLFVTDYFNNKILVFDLDGNLTQTLKGHFNKPTDISVINGELYIPNYGASSIVKYTRQ